MDVKTINRVDTMAETKVTTDTTPACALIPQGIFQTRVLVLVLDSASLSFNITKQL